MKRMPVRQIVRLFAPLAARTALVEATPIARRDAVGRRGRRIAARVVFARPLAPGRCALSA